VCVGVVCVGVCVCVVCVCVCVCEILINLLKKTLQKQHYGLLHTKIMYCMHKSMRGAELLRHLPHRNVGRAEIILHPRMGGHCVVPRNCPAYLGAKVVENGPAWRVLDDELEQLHRRIGQASSGKIAK
jgi:hypothetical protein